ncbi:hypothetical protein D3C86_1609080 [compost metagenome]
MQCKAEVPAKVALFLGDAFRTQGARIASDVNGVSETGNLALRCATARNGGVGQLTQLRVTGIGHAFQRAHRFLHETRADLYRSKEAAAGSQQARSHRALKRFGRAMQGQPRRQRTGRQPVVDRCDKGVVDHPAHLLVGELAQNRQAQDIHEIVLVQEVLDKVVAADADVVGISAADVALEHGVLS